MEQEMWLAKMDKDDSLFLYIGGIPKKNRLDNEWIAKELRITDAILLDKDLFPRSTMVGR